MRIIKTIIIFVFFIYCECSYSNDPKIVAHRGSSINFPENTIFSFENSIKYGADMIELDVQLTKDNQVIIYHPRDLSVLTKYSGPINQYNYDDIKSLNISSDFKDQKHNIILLSEILDKLPNIEIIINFKSLPAKYLVESVIKIIDQKKAWDRIIFYSTNQEHLDHLKKLRPSANLFENRSKTKERLLRFRNESICCCYDYQSKYIGFELNRKMIVEESFALGIDKNEINSKLWDKDIVNCIKKAKGDDVRIFLFGINNMVDYNIAKELNIYGIFTDNILNLDLIGK